MMNNEYDNKKFFEEYSKMPRSKYGLSSAGEWHQLKPLFPSLDGKNVLDLGCGYGWHCKFAEEQGATRILGLDLSHKMIEAAKTRNAGEKIEYRVCGIDEYEYPENTWDCVVSNIRRNLLHCVYVTLSFIYRSLRRFSLFRLKGVRKILYGSFFLFRRQFRIGTPSRRFEYRFPAAFIFEFDLYRVGVFAVL